MAVRSFCKVFPLVLLLGLMSFILTPGLWRLSESATAINATRHVLTDEITQKYVEVVHSLAELHSQNFGHQMVYSPKVRGSNQNLFNKSLPVIYAITPTYSRDEQKADLTRVSQTFLHLPNFHWIIVEDSEMKTQLVTSFLSTCGISNTHLNGHSSRTKHRGVLQRNLALSWIREHLNPQEQPGVIYFADDDNTYDLRIFAEMRWTKKVSIWPVGLVGGSRYERPIVTNGKVTGWFVAFAPRRPFATDMAGFAVNLQLLFDTPGAAFTEKATLGYIESYFLQTLNVTLDDLEPKADNCSKILVWHTRTQKTNLIANSKLMQKFIDMEV